jgi:hypothetical protein
MEDTFDIFAGTSDHLELAVWMAVVVGLSCARQRMQEKSAARPGDYFVSDARTHAVVDQIHNGPRNNNQFVMRKTNAA